MIPVMEDKSPSGRSPRGSLRAGCLNAVGVWVGLSAILVCAGRLLDFDVPGAEDPGAGAIYGGMLVVMAIAFGWGLARGEQGE